MNYQEYLQQRHSPRSVNEHEANLKRFKAWCTAQLTEPGHSTYREILAYIQHLQNRQVKNRSINVILNSLTKYYDYLIESGKITENPARLLRVKSSKESLLTNLLTTQQLQEVYQQYKQLEKPEKHQPAHQRNTVILSLMIHQAASATELKRLEVNHIDFEAGTIYLPGSLRSASRTIKLNPAQIIPLHQYVLQTRQKLNPKAEKLFSGNISNQLQALVNELKSLIPEIQNAQQIRSSVIANWLQHHNIRQVQYMAGHKHISSTERYRQQDTNKLKKALDQFHPLATEAASVGAPSTKLSLN